MTKKNRTRDYVVYVGVGLLVACGAAAYGIYTARHGIVPQFKNDWTVALVTAGIAFGFVLRSPSPKHDARFWVVWSLLLLLHFVIFLPVLSRMNKVPLVLGGLIAPVEFVALSFLLNKLLNHSKHSLNH
jgi:cell division protein FtsW (lipid II flippase)